MAPLRSAFLFAAAASLLSCAVAEDLFPNKVHVDSSTLWSIEYHDSWKYLVNVGTKNGYVLYQKGTAKPPAKNETDKFFEVPVEKAAIFLTTVVPYLEMLGLRDKIAVVEYEEAIASGCVLSNIQKQSTLAINSNNKTEVAAQLSGVDIIFDGQFTNDTVNNAKNVLSSASQDPGPLRRVEWLEFYSAFFNYEKQANELTSSINDNYNCISKKAIAVAGDKKPVFAWASYVAPSQYNNNTASYTISVADFKKDLVSAAGGQVLETSTGGNLAGSTITFNDLKPFQEALKGVDVLLDETYGGAVTDMKSFYTQYGLTAESDYKFIKNKSIYRYDLLQTKGGGVDWLSNGVLMQDAALEDVANSLHEKFTNNYEFKWFRNIAKDVAVKISSEECKDPAQPLKSYATQCTADSKNFSDAKGSATSVVTSLLASSVLAFVASILVI
ncbi:hypothetical protein K7432_008258 [Basidiobolus ranarum]|uniref:Uncharacterized protein n=1 Tax=Basidiobolus ranarum TaxID=34480 RepID=A0ABR2WS53_9FUNG